MKLLLPSSGKHSINEIESQHFIVSPLVIEMQFCFALVYPLEIKSHLFLDNFSKHPLVCAFHEIRFAIKCAHYFHQSQFYQQSFSAITDCFQTILDGEILSKLNFMSNECDAMRFYFYFYSKRKKYRTLHKITTNYPTWVEVSAFNEKFHDRTGK